MLEPTFKLYNADCLEVLPTLTGINAIIADPPYLIDNDGGGNPAGAGGKRLKTRHELDGLSDGFDIEGFWPMARNICKPFNCFIFCANRQIAKLMSMGEDDGVLTVLLVWNKYNSVPFANYSWRQDAEFIVHYRERGACFDGNAEDKRKVVRLPSNSSQYGHPTEKPLVLIERYVTICSRPGDTVLDPFMGSGTTGVACMKLGRNFIGIEIASEYYEIAKRRIEQAQSQLRLFA